MARKYYLLDENGTIKSADGSKKYRLLEGQDLYEFLHSPQRKEKAFLKTEDINGNEIRIEIPSEHRTQYIKEVNRENYVRRTQMDLDIQVVSFNTVIIDGEEMAGEEAIPDDSQSLEEQMIEREEIDSLKDALRSLSEEELYIIKSLYLNSERKTEKILGCEIGVSQQAIHKKKQAILEKIKKILEQ
ncbi:MAG: hypothetical protein ACI4VK_01375 [Candidatus Coproplasma sp.]